MSRLQTAVALTVFNNPDATRRVFASVAAARPEVLFVIGDAPRVGIPGEAEQCAQARRIATAVDWPCKLEVDFSTENMGPRRRLISGLNWVFSHVESAIVLEHDCLPHPSFFPYCFELLERYREHRQIGYITGFNPIWRDFPFEFSYYYSRVAHLWGWATWRHVWSEYDESLTNWPEVRNSDLLYFLFPDRKVVNYWTGVFDRMHNGTGPDTWDYQMAYTCWVRNLVNIVPKRNLIQYIGFVPNALHTNRVDPGLELETGPIDFPLLHPPAITPWPAQEMGIQRRFYSRNVLRRIRRRLIMEYRALSHS